MYPGSPGKERQRLRQWLDEHPDDEEVLGCGEGLKMLEDGLLLEKDKPAGE